MATASTVPTSGDTGLGASLPEGAILHRHDWWGYILNDPSVEPWHREHLARLRRVWEEANDAHYGGALVPPYVLLAEPSEPKRYGDCGRVSGFGGRSQIRLRPSLLVGTHPHVRAGDAYAEGRARFVADMLLHEMVHQWQQEVSGQVEEAYHGHGPAFRDRANAIGAALDLPPVRTMKRRGPDRDRPSCSQWPHTVRPADYYLGAYDPPSPEQPAATGLPCLARADNGQFGHCPPGPPVPAGAQVRDGRGDGVAPLSGPRELLPRDGPEYAAYTLEELRFQWAHVVDSVRRAQLTLAQVAAARLWERWPRGAPYGSLEALLLAELGVSADTFRRVPASRDGGQEAAG